MTDARISPFVRLHFTAIVLATSVIWALNLNQIGAVAEEDTTNPFSELGLPTIGVTITNEAFEGVPHALPAGRYVLAVTNAYDDVPDDTAGAAFLRLPDTLPAVEFTALVTDEDSSWPAAWHGETTLAGGAYADLGETAYAVIDLAAGSWVLWSEAIAAPQDPVAIAVTGPWPADLPAPVADVTIELTEFAIGLSAPLRAGHQVIEVANSGQQPHFVFIGSVPVDSTVAEAQAAFAAYWDPESSPPARFSFADTRELVGTGDQSAGTSAWYAIEIPAGTVVAACFVTDPETGKPHAMLGMTEIWNVSQDQQNLATTSGWMPVAPQGFEP